MNKKKYNTPEDFELETSTVRSFSRRGKWATHDSKYRGNWSPDVVRNLILRYSEEGDLLLDPMIWGWTTAIEAKTLNRNLIAYDINPNAVMQTIQKLDFDVSSNAKVEIGLHDARDLSHIQDETVDLILNHPPYADIIRYSNWEIEEDLSNIHNLEIFCNEMEEIAKHFFRTLKSWKYCAILIWDTRRKKLYQPLAYMLMQRFMNVGFLLKEDVIKIQHNCKATGFWAKRSQEYNFLLIMHEHLFIFQKP